MSIILKIRKIQKAFDKKVIHRDVNFDLHKGETIGLLGNSGTGKSVLLRSIVGLEHIDDGEIYFNDQRIDLLGEKEMYPVRTQISYAFQSGALFDSLSVFENIAYPLFEHTKKSETEITEEVIAALKMVNMEHAIKLMPSDLSGGMQKRAGLARSMILNPQIILYDEPTAGLDPVNVENVLDIMSKFKKKGISGIFVTHDIPAARKICDRLLILDEGKVAFEGTVSEFDQSTSKIVKRFTHPEEVHS